VRKGASPAHHLIGLLWIDSKAKRERDRLIKFGGREFLQRRDRIGECVILRPIYLLRRRAITFASIRLHCSSQSKRLPPFNSEAPANYPAQSGERNSERSDDVLFVKVSSNKLQSGSIG